MQVAAGVHRFTLGISNWYAIEEGGRLTLVDAGTRDDWKVLLHALDEQHMSLSNVDTVLLTHAHADHTGFAERARAQSGATVRVHQADEHAALTGKRGKAEGGAARYLVHREAYRTLFGLLRHGGANIVPIKEVSTFAADEVIDVPGKPRVVHAPGHTAGTSALWFEGRSLICTGDALVLRNPLTGRIGPQIMPTAFNENTDQALRSLDAFGGVRAGVVLPGHGEPWTDGLDQAVQRARVAGRS